MAKVARSFAADIGAWARKTEDRLVEVPRESARLAARSMTDPSVMPRVTGNLAHSLTASTAAMPTIDFSKVRPLFTESEAQIEGVVANAQIGQTIFLGFRAPYAKRIETKRGFVRLTVQRWQQIVTEAVRNVRARTGGD